jgi:GNAT superfamily N-acetyltransferase
MGQKNGSSGASKITIRAARFDDEAEVLPLIEELFVPPGRKPADYTHERAQEGFRRAVGNEDSDVLLALDGDTPVGAATVYVDTVSIRYGLRCWVEDLIVLPSQRGGGVGKLLLDAAMEWGRAQGCDFVQLHSGLGRKDAHRFYLANGMEQDSLVFTKNLGPRT